ncbi:MAG TPA: AAA-like domain-containing protein [Candidatus Solibacter sp.]|jgi:DNA-binding winged helix-turn-helix (wHTH) protein|nr:AAA-like domain-containing protein [Candidatus Solibacter sp.]
MSRLIYEFGPYRLEPEQFRLECNGRRLSLRPRLMDLLLEFVAHSQQVLTKDHLLNKVWPDTAVEENNLTVSVTELRKIIGKESIETLSGRGYRFALEVRMIVDSQRAPASTPPEAAQTPSGPPVGALPLHSPLYIARDTDDEFHGAIARRDSFVLVKGARQVGKTSLLARGLQRAREAGATVLLTDFQHLTADAFTNTEKLLLTLGELIANSLDLEARPHQSWNNFASPTSNFERYLRREVLPAIKPPLVWGMDEVDRVFHYPYANDIFGLFRSWHNLRALDPEGPWQRLTAAMVYATEAQLFITDLNQSPFNVGTRLSLEDFNCGQVAELNRCHGSPLSNAEVEEYFALVGGNPYLVQLGFYAMANRGLTLAALQAQSDLEEGLFDDHLHRMLLALEEGGSDLCEAVRNILRGQPGLTVSDFYRLRSAGVLTGNSAQNAKPRCELYANYLKKQLL